MKNVKIFFLTLFIFCLGVINVEASTNTIPRDENNNYNIKKQEIIIDERNISNIKSTPYVDASEKIYDFAEILNEDEERELYELVLEYIKETNMDMVILTDNKYYSHDSSNEVYATDFYDYNDFGLSFEHYSGVLFYRNAYESDPYYDVYMFGEAQLYYDQDRCDEMLDDVYDKISTKQYLDGLKQFISMFKDYYHEGIPSDMKAYYIDDMGFMQEKYQYPFMIAFFLAASITTIVIYVYIKKNRMVKKANKAEEYLDRESIVINNKVDNFLRSHTTSYTVSSSSSSGGSSGGHSSSGSSGMGHSSGGGRHG